jgi:hypothetical protein
MGIEDREGGESTPPSFRERNERNQKIVAEKI